MLGNRSEAEDIGQETFVRFCKSLKNFRGESSIGTYIIRIAINLSLNELKRRKRRNLFFFSTNNPGTEIENLRDNSSLSNNHHEKEEMNSMIHTALEQLKPKYRSVIVLRLIDGYSTQETADILSLPVGTVLSRLARGQGKLKNLLEPYLVSRDLYTDVKR